jgi:hypothetical protein
MKHPIEVPPELFAEWLAEGRKQYSEPALIAGFVAEKAAQWAADRQLKEAHDWILCLGCDPKTGIRWELDMLQLDRLGKELWQAMRPKPPSLKEEAAKELLHLRQEMKRHGLDVPTTPALVRVIKSIPDADS